MSDAVESTAAPPAAPAERTAAKPAGTRGLVFAGQRYGLAVIFVAVIIVFSLLSPDSFPTAANLRNIASNQSVLAIVTLAAIVPLIAGHFDLSIGAGLIAASTVTASLLSHGAPLWLAALAAVVLGILVGLFNGFMVSKIGVNALILTLGVGIVLDGLTLKYTGGQSIITGIPDSLTDFGSGTWLGIPRVTYMMVLVALLVWYLLEHTPYGRELHAVGANPLAARLVGIRVDRIVIFAFAITGALVGVAAVLLIARQGGSNPQLSAAFTLPVLAAAFLGATTIHPGRFNVPGTLLAIFFLGTSTSGLALEGVDNWVDSVFNGGSLIVAVTLSTVLGRRLSGT